MRKIAGSHFLAAKKPLLKDLVSRLSKEYEYVSVLGTDCFGKDYQISMTNVKLNDSSWCERGFVVRIYNGKNYSEHSFNEIDETSIDEIVNNIKSVHETSVSLRNSGISSVEFPVIQEEEITEEFYGEVRILPEELSDGEILEKLTHLKEKSLKMSDKLINIQLSYGSLHVRKVFISTKKDLEQNYLWSQGYIVPFVRREDDTRYNFTSVSGLKGLELLDEIDEILEDTITETESLLGTERLQPGEYEVICDPSIAGLIAHEAFGHGVEMDMYVKNRAKSVEYMNKEIASSLVTMRDGAKSAKHVSSFLFDDEGTIGEDTVIIDNGILKAGLSDILSALKLGTMPTGNGKRESYKRKAYARMTNTFFEPGHAHLDDMIKSINNGFLLSKFSSGMEDPKNWGIQCMILMAKEIKNGELTGKIYSPVIMTGYVPDLLKSISMVSVDFDLEGSGACGKGYKEFVKTSTGGPYIKAIAKLG